MNTQSVFDYIHEAVHEATAEILKLRNEIEYLKKELGDYAEDYTRLELEYDDMRKRMFRNQARANLAEADYKREFSEHVAFREITEHFLGDDFGELFCRNGVEGSCPNPRVPGDPDGLCHGHANDRDCGGYDE